MLCSALALSAFCLTTVSTFDFNASAEYYRASPVANQGNKYDEVGVAHNVFLNHLDSSLETDGEVRYVTAEERLKGINSAARHVIGCWKPPVKYGGEAPQLSLDEGKEVYVVTEKQLFDVFGKEGSLVLKKLTELRAVVKSLPLPASFPYNGGQSEWRKLVTPIFEYEANLQKQKGLSESASSFLFGQSSVARHSYFYWFSGADARLELFASTRVRHDRGTTIRKGWFKRLVQDVVTGLVDIVTQAGNNIVQATNNSPNLNHLGQRIGQDCDGFSAGFCNSWKRHPGWSTVPAVLLVYSAANAAYASSKI